MCKFILASASPRRREILNNVGMEFEVLVSKADESKIDRNIEPEMLVLELSMLKATDVASSLAGDCYVIGADTVVSLDGKILEKPTDESDARRMLKDLSGKTHSVYTGVCIYSTKTGKAVSKFQKTDVKFKKLSKQKIEAYIESKEPMDKASVHIWDTNKTRYEWEDKAGGYGIQGKGALLIDEIRGDYFNVVGLPISLLSDMFFDEFGIEI